MGAFIESPGKVSWVLSELSADFREHMFRNRSSLAARLGALLAPGFWVCFAYRLSHVALNVPLIGKPVSLVINFLSNLFWGCYISPKAVIGPGLCLPHPTGIVIGMGAKIGSRVRIYQNVTIGSKTRGARRYPAIGDGVTLFAGAVLIGDITIGERATVGANSVLSINVPADATAVGNPAIVTARSGSS